MVNLITNTPEFAGELCDEVRLFLDVRKIYYDPEILREGISIVHEAREGNPFSHSCVLYCDGAPAEKYEYETEPVPTADFLEYKKLRKRGAKIAVFRCLKKYFGEERPWGSLTGVRPTKLLRETMEKEGLAAAKELLREEFDVSEDKIELLRNICGNQQPLISSVQPQDLDIYIGIPFCISKCAYCSFSSSLTSRDGEKEKRYVDALLSEMRLLEGVIKRHSVRSVYVGGGTPTSLSEEQLKRVVSAAGELASGEFTVEAGRPDTITKSKLEILKAAGVNRISINPQTTCDDTLKAIGRIHTADAFFRAAETAKKYAFDVVNMDLIIGLPGEGRQTFARSLDDVLRLAPENITVHTLAIKRASKFGMANQHSFASREEAEDILAASQKKLLEAGYQPYYMYRQKYMTGNLENVGYAQKGAECIYNVDIMEEVCSILAFGAGGITKRVFNEATTRIERAPTVKDINLYIEKTAEMAARKLALFEPVDF